VDLARQQPIDDVADRAAVDEREMRARAGDLQLLNEEARAPGKGKGRALDLQDLREIGGFHRAEAKIRRLARKRALHPAGFVDEFLGIWVGVRDVGSPRRHARAALIAGSREAWLRSGARNPGIFL